MCAGARKPWMRSGRSGLGNIWQARARFPPATSSCCATFAARRASDSASPSGYRCCWPGLMASIVCSCAVPLPKSVAMRPARPESEPTRAGMTGSPKSMRQRRDLAIPPAPRFNVVSQGASRTLRAGDRRSGREPVGQPGQSQEGLRPMSRFQADILLLFTALIWGVAFLFQKSATAHVGPLTFLALRGLIAFLALAPLALREGRRAPSPARADFYLTSVAGGMAFLVAGWLQQAGLETATVTNTGFLTALYVVITPLIVL